jgi:hypothetical protein
VATRDARTEQHQWDRVAKIPREIMSKNTLTVMPRFVSTLPSRRDFVRGLAGAGLGVSALHLVDHGEAKKKRKRQGKQRKNRQQPLPPVTAPPPPPFAGTCSVQRNRCTVADPVLATCNLPDEFATCLVTTSDTPFCGSLLAFNPAVHCQACATNADCATLNFPPGTACVQIGGKFCNGCEATGNRACVPPALSA